jgi:hypothetical protein
LIAKAIHIRDNFLKIDRYVYSISHSVPEFGTNMAQVTLGEILQWGSSEKEIGW